MFKRIVGAVAPKARKVGAVIYREARKATVAGLVAGLGALAGGLVASDVDLKRLAIAAGMLALSTAAATWKASNVATEVGEAIDG